MSKQTTELEPFPSADCRVGMVRSLLFCCFLSISADALAQPQIKGSLDQKIIARTMRGRMAGIKRCYEKNLASLASEARSRAERAEMGGAALPDRDPGAGKIAMEFVIGPDGSVTGVRVRGGSAKLRQCLTRVLQKMAFPKPKGGGSVMVSYPLMFSATGGMGSASEEGSGSALSNAFEDQVYFPPRGALPANPETRTKDDQLSTFAVDVDTASFSLLRTSLDQGMLPDRSLIRVEEIINYFSYDYDPPTTAPFSINIDGARSPVDNEKHLLRIGLQARIVSPLNRMPVNLVFLVDTSGSMQMPNKLPLVKKSLAIAVDQLDARDQVAITTYAGSVSLVLPPTSGADKARIKGAINQLNSGGGTAMASGMEMAYRQAAAMLSDGRVTRIIVCSDGDANIGASTHEAMLAQVKGYVSEGVTISTIGFGDGNYQDENMEQIADNGDGNYFYIDHLRQAERVFARDFIKMVQLVAQDVKVQVEMNKEAVERYRLVGYENRDVKDEDFTNDRVDGGEIGAGHQVTALYQLTLRPGASGTLATVRVRTKEPRALQSTEVARTIKVQQIEQPFTASRGDFRLAVAAMGGAELLRQSPYAQAWSYDRVINLLSDAVGGGPDRADFLKMMKEARPDGQPDK